MAVRAKLDATQSSDTLYLMPRNIKHTPFFQTVSVVYGPNSPHPPVRFAVGGIDADGSLTVTRRLGVVPHFAVSCSPVHTDIYQSLVTLHLDMLDVKKKIDIYILQDTYVCILQNGAVGPAVITCCNNTQRFLGPGQ